MAPIVSDLFIIVAVAVSARDGRRTLDSSDKANMLAAERRDPAIERRVLTG